MTFEVNPLDGGVWADVSFDGGHTWKTSEIAANGAGDPAVTILNDGTVVASVVTPDFGNDIIPGAPLAQTALLILKSTDGGVSFSKMATLRPDAALHTPDWRVSGGGITHDDRGDVLVSWPHEARANDSLGDDLGFAFSTDGAVTWHVGHVTGSHGYWRTAPAILPNGDFWIATYDERGPNAALAIARSEDQGATWKLHTLDAGNVADDAPPAIIVRNNLSVAVGYATIAEQTCGAQDPPSAEVPRMITTTDAGASWSPPLSLDKPEACGQIRTSFAGDAKGAVFAGFYHALSGRAPWKYEVARIGADERLDAIVVDTNAGGAWGTADETTGIAGLDDGAFATWTHGLGIFGTNIDGAAVRPR
jgi:hypothetical protein